MIERLHERARRVHERELVRAWEYRQRNYSKGVWYRFRRILVDAAQTWIIAEGDADRLESQGHIPLPIGRELSPVKRLFFLTEEELRSVPDRRQIPVRLCVELLQARSVALIAHASSGSRLLPAADSGPTAL